MGQTSNSTATSPPSQDPQSAKLSENAKDVEAKDLDEALKQISSALRTSTEIIRDAREGHAKNPSFGIKQGSSETSDALINEDGGDQNGLEDNAEAAPEKQDSLVLAVQPFPSPRPTEAQTQAQPAAPGAFAVVRPLAASSMPAVPQPPSEPVDPQPEPQQSFVATNVTAHLVTDEDENARLRAELDQIRSAPTAEIVQEKKSSTMKRVLVIFAITILVITAIIVAGFLIAARISADHKEHGDHDKLGDSGLVSGMGPVTTTNPPAKHDAASFSTEGQSRLISIKERGYIRCRVGNFEKESGRGLSLDLCKALSAAIFDGDPNKMEMPRFVHRDMWYGLANGTIDVSTAQISFNMGRDVFEEFSRIPMSFSKPWYFTGATVAGRPDMVDCANRGDTLTGVCKDLVVCTTKGTTTTEVVQQQLDGSGILFVPAADDMFEALANGNCNVISGEPQFIYEQRARQAGYVGEYEVSSVMLSKEPLALVTRGDDPVWTDFVSAVLQALLTSEAEKISQTNATLFPQTSLFGEDYTNMFQNAIAAVGNWGEMYDRTYGLYLERTGPNLLANGNDWNASGLLFSPPLSPLDFDTQFQQERVPKVLANDALGTIGVREYLKCGILPNRPGFAVENPVSNSTSSAWVGVDVDLCRCLSAALFGDPDMVELVPMEDTVTGFMALAEGLVDLMAGVSYTLQADIKEAATGEGFEFSPTYFYGEEGEMLSLVTNQNSTQWSDFVRWSLYGLIYAEEEDITKETAQSMPSVDLFGPEYTQMFRLMVLHFGSFGDLWAKNLEGLVPRQGPNHLNDGRTPLIHPLPLDYFV